MDKTSPESRFKSTAPGTSKLPMALLTFQISNQPFAAKIKIFKALWKFPSFIQHKIVSNIVHLSVLHLKWLQCKTPQAKQILLVFKVLSLLFFGHELQVPLSLHQQEFLLAQNDGTGELSLLCSSPHHLPGRFPSAYPSVPRCQPLCQRAGHTQRGKHAASTWNPSSRQHWQTPTASPHLAGCVLDASCATPLWSWKRPVHGRDLQGVKWPQWTQSCPAFSFLSSRN